VPLEHGLHGHEDENVEEDLTAVRGRQCIHPYLFSNEGIVKIGQSKGYKEEEGSGWLVFLSTRRRAHLGRYGFQDRLKMNDDNDDDDNKFVNDHFIPEAL
jgi:hypothetical protein